MNSASKAAAWLLFTFGAAALPAYALPDITTQSIPFGIQAQEAYPTISADGRYVAYKIQNKITGTTLPPSEIYVHDLVTGQRAPANLSLSGAVSPAGAVCNMPSMSANARYVVMGCYATPMGGSTTGGSAYFVYDREANATQMIPDTGVDRPGSYGSAISANGRFVAFRTMTAGNISRLYVRDLVNRTTSGTSAQLVQSSATRLSISADGRYVAYNGNALSNNGPLNVSVYDRVTGVTEPIDVRLDGSRSTVGGTEITMSDDGTVVAFVSNDKQLAPTAPYGNLAGVYVRDRKTAKTELVSSTANAAIQYAGVSGNGRYVGYAQGGVMYVYDRLTKLTRKITLTGMLPFGAPRFSTDGRYMTFTASNTALTLRYVTVADLGVAPDVSFSTKQLTLTEGGIAGTYSMVLTQAPEADVKVVASTSNQLTLARSELTFTADNWNTPQVISVQAVADGATEGTHDATVTHTISSADIHYNVIAPVSVSATISDGVIPTIAIPAANWTEAALPLSGTAAPGATVLLTAVNRSTGWLSSVSTVADAQGNWSYSLAGYTDGVIDLDVQADGIKSVVRTVAVSLTPEVPSQTM
ncbi:hypothetical protein FHW83_001239 [Duganella sp. SG902]|uniref:TolB family protein n=1 Tax=Duganella sp. SG902 TaxID=2587016 RepID=UPI00159DF4DE|nr:hypothetical protein [Duganella sp. SG902]NVM75459.1 hypothetical protein [Duganella sp. SG902]